MEGIFNGLDLKVKDDLLKVKVDDEISIADITEDEFMNGCFDKSFKVVGASVWLMEENNILHRVDVGTINHSIYDEKDEDADDFWD